MANKIKMIEKRKTGSNTSENKGEGREGTWYLYNSNGKVKITYSGKQCNVKETIIMAIHKIYRRK